MNDKQIRLDWVDVLKFLGIWAIYLGHFAQNAGKAYPFVFQYHVPLFFFASGFFSNRSVGEPFLLFIKKKTLQLMLPYIFFSVIALLVYSLKNQWGPSMVLKAAGSLTFGLRNQLAVGSLWFIPCLFVMLIFNYLLNRITRSKIALLIISFGTYIFAQTLLGHDPVKSPTWLWNFDAALNYYLYFVIGGVVFPFLSRKLSSLWGILKIVILGIISFSITGVIFFYGYQWLFDNTIGRILFISTFTLSIPLFRVIIALAIIYSNVLLAKFLAHIPLLREIGRETLMFCGTEQVIKIILNELIGVVGLTLSLSNPFITVLYALFVLIFNKFTLLNFLNTYFPLFVGKFTLRGTNENAAHFTTSE